MADIFAQADLQASATLSATAGGFWNSSLSEQITLNESLYVALLSMITETIQLNESLSPMLRVLGSLDDGIGLHDDLTGICRFGVALADTVGVADELSTFARVRSSLEDTFALSTTLEIGDATYVGWVVNSESLAVSKYAGFDFNSMTKFRGQYYGAKQDGVYLLEGVDDAGTDIDAYIRTGLIDFGSEYQKRNPKLYLGYASSGEMVLKTITDEGVERFYELTTTNNRLNSARIKLGRGVQFRYIQYELQNRESSSFDIESLELFPIILSRRVR